MPFSARQKAVDTKQIYNGNINEVFRLFCPTRQNEWLSGWSAEIVYSKTGHIEKDCVFTTQFENSTKTIWYVSECDEKNSKLEFIRVTPGELAVRINISLRKIDETLTEAGIAYTYTGLNEEQNKFIKEDLEKQFFESMGMWERALNHYLTTGMILRN